METSASSSEMTPSKLSSSSVARFCAYEAMHLLDHTYLPSSCTSAQVKNFVEEAMSIQPYPYCFCVFPQYISQIKNDMRREIPNLDKIKLACVVNFPHGRKPIDEVVSETKAAVADGVDEIDLVFNYRLFIDDYEAGCKHNRDLIRRVKEVTGERPLKVILETGELSKKEIIEKAAKLVIEAGGDFLKTSTGKTSVSATPEAVSTLIQVIKEFNQGENKHVGLKISGGVKTLEDAANYMCIYAEVLGLNQLQPHLFRFGASSLWKNLVTTLHGENVSAELSSPSSSY